LSQKKILFPDEAKCVNVVKVETHPPPPVIKLRPASVVVSKPNRSRENLNLRLKKVNYSSSNSTLGPKSFCGSNDTLKAGNSVSDFSQHSGDPGKE